MPRAAQCLAGHVRPDTGIVRAARTPHWQLAAPAQPHQRQPDLQMGAGHCRLPDWLPSHWCGDNTGRVQVLSALRSTGRPKPSAGAAKLKAGGQATRAEGQAHAKQRRHSRQHRSTSQTRCALLLHLCPRRTLKPASLAYRRTLTQAVSSYSARPWQQCCSVETPQQQAAITVCVSFLAAGFDPVPPWEQYGMPPPGIMLSSVVPTNFTPFASNPRVPSAAPFERLVLISSRVHQPMKVCCHSNRTHRLTHTQQADTYTHTHTHASTPVHMRCRHRPACRWHRGSRIYQHAAGFRTDVCVV